MGWVFLPGHSRRGEEGSSGSWKKRGAEELGGCLWSCSLPRDDPLGSSWHPHSSSLNPALGSQQQSLLKKMFAIDTAPDNSGQIQVHQLSREGGQDAQEEEIIPSQSGKDNHDFCVLLPHDLSAYTPSQNYSFCIQTNSQYRGVGGEIQMDFYIPIKEV